MEKEEVTEDLVVKPKESYIFDLNEVTKNKVVIPPNKKGSYQDGFNEGFEYAIKIIKRQSLTEEDISILAWRYSCAYLTDKKHPLCYYLAKIIKEQAKRDALRNSKLFEIWLEKVLEFCKELYSVELARDPGNRLIEIDKEELLKCIKGIDL